MEASFSTGGSIMLMELSNIEQVGRDLRRGTEVNKDLSFSLDLSSLDLKDMVLYGQATIVLHMTMYHSL